NWSAVRSSVTDFNENSVVVQGGKGFAGTPPSANVYNHGFSQGVSDALDAQTLWVQTVRSPIMPDADAAAVTAGRAVFETNCASCHGGAKWTKSQIVYADNPAFTANPIPTPPTLPGVPRDPGVNAGVPAVPGGQIQQYVSNGQTIRLLDPVGTFAAADITAANSIEIRSN